MRATLYFAVVACCASVASGAVVRYEIVPEARIVQGISVPVAIGAVASVDSVVVNASGQARFLRERRTCPFGATYDCDAPIVIQRDFFVGLRNGASGSWVVYFSWEQSSDGSFTYHSSAAVPSGSLGDGLGQLEFMTGHHAIDFSFYCEMYDCQCGICDDGELTFEGPVEVEIYFQPAVATQETTFGAVKAVYR